MPPRKKKAEEPEQESVEAGEQEDSGTGAENVTIPNVSEDAVSGGGEPLPGSGFEQQEATPDEE